MKKITTTVFTLLFTLFLVGQAQAGNKYGAIAFAKNGAHGFSYNFNTKGKARRRALQACRSHGGRGCRVVNWFKNACGALAVTKRNGWGAAWGRTIGKAKRRAMRACRKHNRRGCYIKRTVCTDR